jgi:hypothetical protein
MQIAPIAILICAGLLLLGHFLRAPIVVALFASLAFGSTAIAILPAAGGASPLIYAALACLLVASMLWRRHLWNDFSQVFLVHWLPVVVTALLIYGLASAVIMPRLFAGQTTVFVPIPGRVVETLLSPVKGNVTQSCYFAIGILTFFALSVLLVRDGQFSAVRKGFFAYAALHVSLALVDLTGKVIGVGDILSPIRTADYTMLVETQIEGFWRIVGAYSEASSFAGGSLVALAFSFSYWRATGSRPAFALASVLTLLLLLSTSTTAYASLGILSFVLAVSILLGAMRGRLTSRDLSVLALGVLALTGVLAIAAFDERVLDPVGRLMQVTIFEKSASASAAERFYWNYKSWMAFLDTRGLGVGLGSSRASSWLLAVLSQLGVIGTLLLGLLVLEVFKRPYRDPPAPREAELAALCMSTRAAAVATLLPSLISGGNADPGIFFFLCLATLLAGKTRLANTAAQNHSPGQEWRLENVSLLNGGRVFVSRGWNAMSETHADGCRRGTTL